MPRTAWLSQREIGVKALTLLPRALFEALAKMRGINVIIIIIIIKGGG